VKALAMNVASGASSSAIRIRIRDNSPSGTKEPCI
jgi:hypothetical protein